MPIPIYQLVGFSSLCVGWYWCQDSCLRWEFEIQNKQFHIIWQLSWNPVGWETCFKIVATGYVAFLPKKNVVFWRAFFKQENKTCFFCQKVWFELASFIHIYIYIYKCCVVLWAVLIAPLVWRYICHFCFLKLYSESYVSYVRTQKGFYLFKQKFYTHFQTNAFSLWNIIAVLNKCNNFPSLSSVHHIVI